MNRLLIGIACGVLFGLIDVLMTVMGTHADASTAMFLQAFSSRFATGVLP